MWCHQKPKFRFKIWCLIPNHCIVVGVQNDPCNISHWRCRQQIVSKNPNHHTPATKIMPLQFAPWSHHPPRPVLLKILTVKMREERKNPRTTLQGINISHLGKRKIIFKMLFFGDMLVPWRVRIGYTCPTTQKNDASLGCFGQTWRIAQFQT